MKKLIFLALTIIWIFIVSPNMVSAEDFCIMEFNASEFEVVGQEDAGLLGAEVYVFNSGGTLIQTVTFTAQDATDQGPVGGLAHFAASFTAVSGQFAIGLKLPSGASGMLVCTGNTHVTINSPGNIFHGNAADPLNVSLSPFMPNGSIQFVNSSFTVCSSAPADWGIRPTPSFGTQNQGVSYNNALLPIQVGLFTAKKDPLGAGVRVEMVVLAQLDNERVEFKRSLNGEKFQIISVFEGDGTSLEQITYTAWDYPAGGGTVYYTWTQHDIDGTFENGEIVSVTLAGDLEGDYMDYMKVLGNPGASPVLEFSRPMAEVANLQVISISGQVVRTQHLQGGRSVSLEGLSPGSYFVRVTSSEGVIVTKIIIVR